MLWWWVWIGRQGSNWDGGGCFGFRIQDRFDVEKNGQIGSRRWYSCMPNERSVRVAQRRVKVGIGRAERKWCVERSGERIIIINN